MLITLSERPLDVKLDQFSQLVYEQIGKQKNKTNWHRFHSDSFSFIL